MSKIVILPSNEGMGDKLGREYHCTIDLLFDCMTTDNFCFYLQDRLIQTGGQQYSDTSPFSIPWIRWLMGAIDFQPNEFQPNDAVSSKNGCD